MTKKRMQIELTQRGMDDLAKLKEQLEKTTYADTLRASLKITKFLKDEKERDQEIIIRDKKTGKEKEFLI